MENLLKPQRPLGVTIIAILAAIQGVVTVILALFLLVFSLTSVYSRGLLVSLAIFFLVLGILTLVQAWGLWTLRRWTYWAVVVIEIIDLIGAVYGLLVNVNSSLLSDIINIALPVIILVYFLADEDVRAAFRT